MQATTTRTQGPTLVVMAALASVFVLALAACAPAESTGGAAAGEVEAADTETPDQSSEGEAEQDGATETGTDETEVAGEDTDGAGDRAGTDGSSLERGAFPPGCQFESRRDALTAC